MYGLLKFNFIDKYITIQEAAPGEWVIGCLHKLKTGMTVSALTVRSPIVKYYILIPVADTNISKYGTGNDCTPRR